MTTPTKAAELASLAAEFNRHFTSANSAAPNARISVPTAEWQQLYAALLRASEGRVPEGWRLVPAEATQEMCAAAVKFANGDAVYKNVTAKVLEIEEGIYGEAYEAMLTAAPHPPAQQAEKVLGRDSISMPQYWSVDVTVDGESIVSIGHEHLSGSRALDERDEETIKGAAQHLLSFVGYGLPPCTFDPDDGSSPPPHKAEGAEQ
ncbi:MAG: hypothetical protein WAQ08_15970 [Aquabacterium sp.]|uniref:hypothetical protein n=1 Tax=Aquabacterium sp. TaxID=1872578 RepID=UPI003BAF0E39